MMANDLISCALALVIGAGGLIAVRRYDKKLPEYNRRRRQLEGMNRVELHAELTRCVGAIVTCARKRDAKGMRNAYRAMRPVMRVLKKR